MNTDLQAIEGALRVLIRDCPAMAAADCQEALRVILHQVQAIRSQGQGVEPAPGATHWKVLPRSLSDGSGKQEWMAAETSPWREWPPVTVTGQPAPRTAPACRRVSRCSVKPGTARLYPQIYTPKAGKSQVISR